MFLAAICSLTQCLVSCFLMQATKSSYINYENTLGEFQFPLGIPYDAKTEFEPRFQAGRATNAVSKTDSHYLSVNFASNLDNSGILTHGRPSLDLVFVVDISGSMSIGFGHEYPRPGSQSDTSKLGVAKRCEFRKYPTPFHRSIPLSSTVHYPERTCFLFIIEKLMVLCYPLEMGDLT